jgi:hypothetical protein
MKNKIIRPLAALIMIGSFLLPCGFTVEAAGSNVAVSGNESGIAVKCDADLFTDFKGMLPGQTEKQVVTVANGSSLPLDLYLRAENADASDFDTPAQSAISQEIVDQCQLTLSQIGPDGTTEKVIYAGPLAGAPANAGQSAMTSNVTLGNFASNSSAQLVATLSVPSSLGNRYQNATAKVKWVFTAQSKDQAVSAEAVISPPKTGQEFDSTVYLWALTALLLLGVTTTLTILHHRNAQKQ